MPKSIGSWLSSRLDPVLTPEGPGAAVGVFENGKVRYWRGFGRQTVHGQPISPATLFDLASNTKQFTAAILLLLEQQKKLSLNDEVQRFLPELPRYGRPLRLRHLLYHTSGLRDCGNLEGIADKDHASSSRQGYLRCAFRQKELNFKSGSRHFYSNTNYILLAEVASRASSTDFSSLVREKLLKPAGMRDTLITPLKSIPASRFAMAYFQDGNGWNQCHPDFSDHHTGATGIYCNLGDFNLWIRALTDGLIGGMSLMSRLLTPGRLDNGAELEYAAGVFLGKLGRHRLVYHGGATAAWTSQYQWLPDRGLLSACFASHPGLDVWKLAPDLARKFLGIRPALKAPPKTPVNQAPLPQQALAAWRPVARLCGGRYWSEEALCGIRIIRRSNSLFLEMLRTGSRHLRPMVPLDSGRYGLELFPPSTQLEFEDQAKAFRLHFGEGSRVFSLRFERKK